MNDKLAHPPAEAATAAEATLAAPRRRPFWRRGPGLLPSVLALPLLLGSAGSALWWGLATQSGGEWLLGQVPGLQIESMQGSLIGDLSAKRLRYQLPASGGWVEVDELQWQGLKLAWHSSPKLWASMTVDRLQAKRVHVHLEPSTEASQPPTDLSGPLALQVGALQIETLELPSLGGKPLTELRGSLAAGADGGAQHLLRLEHLRWDLLQLSAQASIMTRGELKVQAELNLQALANAEKALPAWTAGAKINGPLQDLRITAELQALQQQLQLQAQLQPFAAWPLPQAKLTTSNLDLSALASGMPRTALSGQAAMQLQPSSPPAGSASPRGTEKGSEKITAELPAMLNIKSELSNSLAGLWDSQRLPLRELKLDLSVAPSDPAQLDIKRLDLLLGSAQQPAGRVHARGASSQKAGSELVIAVDGLNSAGLDSRAAALRLAGEIELSTARAITQLGDAEPPPLTLRLDANLDGRWHGTGSLTQADGAPLSLRTRAQVSRIGLNLRSFRLQSEGSELQASGDMTLRQAGSIAAGWRAQAKVSAQLPDLRRFWRGNEGSAWQQSPQALAALFEADLQAGPRPGHLQLARGAPGTQSSWRHSAPLGTARLQLLQTQIAGMPVGADLDYRFPDRSGTPRLQIALQAGANNQLQAQASLDEAGQLLADSELKFADLGGLQPLLAAFSPPEAKKAPQLTGSLGGKLSLQASALAAPAGPSSKSAATENWSWHSRAGLQARALQVSGLAGLPALKLGAAQLQWELDSAKDAALELKASLDQLSASAWKLPAASATVQGSWAQHRLNLQLLAEGKMPPALIPPGQPQEQSLRGPVKLSLQGGLSSSPNLAWRDGAQWRAGEIKLLAQAEPPPLAAGLTSAGQAGSSRPPWLNAKDLKLALDLAPGASPKQLQLEPGRLEILGAGLRWQAMKWAAAATKTTSTNPVAEVFDIDLALEPVAVAPLLARWQPDFGWSGDLRLVGHARIKSSPSFGADIALERSGGDLSVTDDSGVQKLELSDLRLGLIGGNGLWHLTQALAGANIGVLAGAVTARNEDSSQLWPRADSRLEGVFEMRIANLSTWGAWVPAGWRMGGSLFASAGFGGLLRAPEIKGRAGGSALVLRNPLLGVDLQRGEFALSLDGDKAKLQQFKAFAGDGELTAQGDLLLGANPQAELQIQADKFALLRRVDQRLAVNGKLDLRLDAQVLDVQGQLSVHEGLFDFSRGNAPSLDSDVEVIRPATHQASVAAAEAAQSAAANQRRHAKVKVKIDIDLGNKLRVSGFGLDTLLAGTLQLTQAAHGPALHGRIRTESGTFAAYGQKLAIERGLIIFNGVLDNPRLDVLAIRPTQEEQRIGVTITGSARNPRVKLFSEPALDERSMLSWLLLGRGPDELNSRDNALLSSAAMALLSGTGEGRASKLIKSVGLDDLSFSDSGDQAQGTVVRLGKQISTRWYVGYERGLNATRGSWQAIYRLAQRFTLRAQSGDDNSLDLIWQWRWE